MISIHHLMLLVHIFYISSINCAINNQSIIGYASNTTRREYNHRKLFDKIRRQHATGSDITDIEDNFGEFLQQEFDYSAYLSRNTTGAKSVPFRDIGNESYWHVDMIDKAGLQYYIESELRPELQKLVDDSKLHWLPIESIISELEQCQHFQYNSVSDQHFTFDRNVFGFMTFLKLSCLLVNDDYYLFGMSLQGFQFRLKNIILRRRRFPIWSKRTVNARDVRKILDYLRKMFAERLYFDYMQTMEQTFEEVIDRHRHKSNRNGNQSLSNDDLVNKPRRRLLPISPGAITALYGMFVDKKDTDEQPLIADHYFTKLSLPLTIRLMTLPKSRIASVIPLFEHSISDESRQSLINCTTAYCQQTGIFVETSSDPDAVRLIERKFSQDMALRYDFDNRPYLNGDSSLLVTAGIRSEFTFDKLHRYVKAKPIEIVPEFTEEMKEEWSEFLEKQTIDIFTMNHNQLRIIDDNDKLM